MKRIFTLCMLFAVGMALSSCKKSGEDEVPGTGKDLVLTPLEQQKLTADNAFTFKLFKQVASTAGTDKNLMLSPLSVSMALGMTSNGSSGQTLEAIRNTMEFKNFTEEQVNSYYKHLITDLPEVDPLVNVKIANSIWYRNNITVAAPFLQTNTNYYKAAVQALDFNNPSAKGTINDWVSNQTNGKIPTIVDEIPSAIIMYLINAVYFKSNWKYQFDKSKTAKGTFKISSGSTVQADFMATKATLNTAQNTDACIYELPYGNGKYSMVMVLPNQNKNLADIVSTLDTTKWNSWMSKLSAMSSDIKMPKFKFSYNKQLKNALEGLGMGIAFSDRANFSRINPDLALAISEVKHKTYIDVNEEGTEAAAVTSVGIFVTSVPPVITIDRPFLFAIREIKTGLIMFTGIVNNPLLTE